MKKATQNLMDAWTITGLNIILLEVILVFTAILLFDDVITLYKGGRLFPKRGAFWFFYYVLIWIDPFCRMAIRNYCRLPKRYILPSYLLTIAFIPVALFNDYLFFAIIGALISVLYIIGLPIFNIYYLIRARRESAFEPLPPDQIQDSPPPQSPVS